MNLQQIINVLYGNGQPGLVKDVTKLKETVNHMNEHLESLSDSYSALAKSQIEYDVTQKMKMRTFRIMGAIFALVIPLTALIIKLL